MPGHTMRWLPERDGAPDLRSEQKMRKIVEGWVDDGKPEQSVFVEDAPEAQAVAETEMVEVRLVDVTRLRDLVTKYEKVLIAIGADAATPEWLRNLAQDAIKDTP